jgi:hypothetical protein
VPSSDEDHSRPTASALGPPETAPRRTLVPIIVIIGVVLVLGAIAAVLLSERTTAVAPPIAAPAPQPATAPSGGPPQL